MRIGLISSFPPSQNGLAVYTYKLCKAMVEEDENIEVLVISDANANPIDMDRVRVVKALNNKSFLYPFKVLQAFAKQKPDVIHCQHEFWLYGRGIYSIAGIIMLILLKFLGKNVVTTVHGITSHASLNLDFLDKHSMGTHFVFLKKLYFMFLMKSLIALSSKIIVHLKVMRTMLIQEYNCNENKVIVVPHGTDYQKNVIINKIHARKKLKLSKESKLLLCFGEVWRGKGLKHVIQAMSIVKKTVPNIKLLIAGGYFPESSPESKGLLNELRNKITKLDLHQNIVLRTKFIPEHEVGLYFTASDMALLPYTDSELLRASGPLFRAMSYGVPVIASNTKYFQDVLENKKSAVLVKIADVEGLAQKIISLISDSNLQKKIVGELRIMSQTFAWEKIAASLINLYRHVGSIETVLPQATPVNKRLNVLVVTPSYSPYLGGVEHVVEEMAKGMTEIGCNVSVLTLSQYPSLLGTQHKDGVTIKRIFGLAPFQAYYLPSPSLISDLLFKPYDIVHIHAVHSLIAPVSIFAALLRTKLGRKKRFVVLTPHYHDVGFSWHTRFAWHFYRPIVKAIMRKADIVHSISQFETSLIKNKCNITPITIEHGVAEDTMHHVWTPPKNIRVAYAGRLEKYKRIDMIIRAMKKICENEPEATLLVIGNGPDKDRLTKIAKRSKVNAIFLNFLPRNEYLKTLASCNLVINLSQSEAFGVTILEALAIGIPVLTVKPWGTTFKKYSIAKVLPSNPTIKQVRKAILSQTSIKHPVKPKVLVWREVCYCLYEEIYAQLKHNETSNTIEFTGITDTTDTELDETEDPYSILEKAIER